MPRSRTRSRSPTGSRREKRRRSRSSDRDRRRRHHRSRSKSRDRSRRDRERDPSPSHREIHSTDKMWDREREKRKKEKQALMNPGMSGSTSSSKPITEQDLEGMSQDEIDMMKLMGFSNFDSTKGKQVKGNDVGDVQVIVKRKYRQYMNRKGGFNRPLDFVH